MKDTTKELIDVGVSRFIHGLGFGLAMGLVAGVGALVAKKIRQ